MKTRLITSILLCSTTLACAQSDIIPLAKKRSDNTLIVGFDTGAKTIKISATGTLEWVNGATLTGASYFRAAAGLVIGTDVQAYNANTTLLGSSIDLASEVTGVLGSANGGSGQVTLQASINAFMAASGALSRGDIFYYNGTNVVRLAAGTSGYYLKTQGSGADPIWGAVASGLTIGSTTVAGGSGSAADRRVLFDNNGTLGGASYFFFDDYNQLRVDANIYYGTASGTGVGVFFANGSNFWIGQLYNGLGGQVQMQVVDSHVLNFTAGSSAVGLRIFGDASKYLALAHNGTDAAISASSGNVKITSPVSLGYGGTTHDKIKSGVATLVAGTVTVSDSDVLETGTAATSSRILVTRMNDGGDLGNGYSLTRVDSTSFTITSSSNTETSTLSWMMINP